MPYLKIRLNRTIEDKTSSEILAIASKAVAKLLNKPESYVMVEMESSSKLIFAGTADPAAYLELKSIGLPDVQIPALSKHLCDLLKDHLNIDPARVYIEFLDVKGSHWGWKGGTF